MKAWFFININIQHYSQSFYNIVKLKVIYRNLRILNDLLP